MRDVFVFGENHWRSDDIERISRFIRCVRPVIVLHELLYSYTPSSYSDIKRQLKSCRDGGACDPRLNKDIFELAVEVGFIPIGIDTLPEETFHIRERAMLRNISKVLDSTSAGPIVIVVGDTHLRSQYHRDLGPPSILNTLRDRRDVVWQRSLYPEVM